MKKLFYFIAKASAVMMLFAGAFSCSNEEEPWSDEEFSTLADKRMTRSVEINVLSIIVSKPITMLKYPGVIPYTINANIVYSTNTDFSSLSCSAHLDGYDNKYVTSEIRNLSHIGDTISAEVLIKLTTSTFNATYGENVNIAKSAFK